MITYREYEDIIKKEIGVSLKPKEVYGVTSTYKEVLKDKDFIGYINYSYLAEFAGSLKEALDLKNRYKYSEDLYWYRISNKKLNDFVKKYNLKFKLISKYKLDEKSDEDQIGGIVCFFRNKEVPKHYTQIDWKLNEATKRTMFKVGEIVTAIDDYEGNNITGKKGEIEEIDVNEYRTIYYINFGKFNNDINWNNWWVDEKFLKQKRKLPKSYKQIDWGLSEQDGSIKDSFKGFIKE